ncbi:MAG: PAS domain-containing protein [Planctomycetales bacterium]|nr:PAS domain-containing protein [Planctomycetales bacterium]
MSMRFRFWTAVTTSAVIFTCDMFLPLGIAVPVAYISVVMLAASASKRSIVLWASLLCTLLAAVGGFLSPPPESSVIVMMGVANRVVAIAAIWIAGFIAHRLQRSRAALETLNRELERRVTERSADAQQRAVQLSQTNKQLEAVVAQRQRAELEARDSQAMYASLVEDLPIPIIRKDRNGRFVFANRAFCSWVQKKREDIVGRTDADFAPDALAEKYRHDDQLVLTTGQLFLDVERNEHGGKVNWVHVIKTPARDGRGTIVGTQAIFWDVTARRVAEDKLRESEALYHSLVDTLPICLLRKDRAGVITFVNAALCDFFSLEPSAFVGKTDYDLFPHELAARYRAGDERTLATGQSFSATEEIDLPDGSKRHIDVTKSPVYDADRQIVGVQILFRDVTEELAMERALQASEARLQAILDNTSAVVYMKDAEGKYLLINRMYERLFHVDLVNVVGKTDYDIFPAEFADAFREVDQRVLEGGEAVEIEETAPHEDGPHEYISSKFPLRDDRGKVFAMAGISTDISESKRAARQLADYAARLESTNRELEEFAYIVSHDLQEPLRTLSFFSDSLRTDLAGKLSEQSDRDLQFINDAAQRMQHLVRDLLSLSRAGRAELKREPTPLGECVSAALTALSTRIRERNAQVEFGDLPTVPGDRTTLTQLFQNLIGNAVKFVPSDRVPHVQIKARRLDDAWELRVIDNGIGIKPEYAQKIFAPFQRLHSTSEYEGTGIGLAICRKVVQRHGGAISAEPADNGGTCFTFTLPAN